MDYNDVTAFAYSSASILSFVLTLFLAWSALSDHWKWPITLAAVVQTVWLGMLSLSLSNEQVLPDALLLLEGGQFFAWILALNITLRQLRPGAWPTALKLSLALAMMVLLLTATDILYTGLAGSLVIFAAFMVLSFLALISLEQLVRNAHSSRFLKLLSISLGILFLFNIYLYAQGMINRSVDLTLWQARAALIMAVCFVVVSAGLLFRDRLEESDGLGLSRPVAFYSTSLALTSVCIIVLALGGYYVRTMGGHWGIFLFTLMLFCSLVALSALFLSNRVRSTMQVWVSKHFFRHKYDYRNEWHHVIQALSSIPEPGAVYRTVYQVIAHTFQAYGGGIYVLRHGYWECVYNTDTDLIRNRPPPIEQKAEFVRIMAEQEWVFAPKVHHGAVSAWNHRLPEWITEDPHIQLIVPLIAQEQLLGFVTLEKAGLDEDLGWEDLDILKTIGRQLANHMLIHAQEQQLSEARQLDTYHKLSAFIMHDLNNLIAQLALVVKNSERHKENPAFINDMILTVSHSVTRMKSLMQKFKRMDDELPTRFSILQAVKDAIAACNGNEPEPHLVLTGWSEETVDHEVLADRDRFVLALKHLIKNAQEATPETGSVVITLASDPNRGYRIIITDTGSGMSDAFVDDQLFKPFETTKTGQGIGIGAYLTKGYLEEIGGTLNVDSRLGFGTAMTVDLPTAQSRETT